MLDHHDDIVSDLNALHGVADWRALTSRQFVAYVERLPFYAGTIRGLILAERAKPDEPREDPRALTRLADEGWIETG